MLRLKMIYVVLLVILSSSCASNLPQKPEVDLCAHWLEDSTAQCVNNQTDEYFEIPMYQTDKWIMMSPEHWGLVLLYIKELEEAASDYDSFTGGRESAILSRELRKVLRTDHNLKNYMIKRDF